VWERAKEKSKVTKSIRYIAMREKERNIASSKKVSLLSERER
jgi:hypothetical protein